MVQTLIYKYFYCLSFRLSFFAQIVVLTVLEIIKTSIIRIQSFATFSTDVWTRDSTQLPVVKEHTSLLKPASAAILMTS